MGFTQRQLECGLREEVTSKNLVTFPIGPHQHMFLKNSRCGFHVPLFSLHQVFCNMDVNGGGWTVIQHREDGSLDFQRGWKEYKMVRWKNLQCFLMFYLKVIFTLNDKFCIFRCI